MKINWFSPLPPAETGIALYTATLIPALQKRADLTLWTDQQDWDKRVARGVLVRRFDSRYPHWNELNRADISIYNIGNNILHRGIWETSRRHAGVVILHDSHLQHFFADLYLHHLQDAGGYRQAMRRYHGAKALAAVDGYLIQALSINQLSESFPLTGLALENAFCGVTHSMAGLHMPAFPPAPPMFCLNLPYASEGLARHPAIVPKTSTGAPYQLIAFGFMGPNRRLEPFLEAWSGIPQKSMFRLCIAGRVWDGGYLQKRIQELGLGDLAQICGYLTEEDLHSELARSDLAINLRYPTMGEASLSQLLIWEHGLPSLVTQVGWYATLPRESVAFVRPESEIQDIRRHLRKFLEDPEGFAEMGLRGRETLEREHSPERYAESLLHLIGDAAKWGAIRSRATMAARAGEAMQPWISPAACTALTQRAADAIFDLSHDFGMAEPQNEGVKCAEQNRLSHQYALSVRAYRQGMTDAGTLTESEPLPGSESLNELRLQCRNARLDIEQHQRTHGCGGSLNNRGEQ
jgi:glycosyltransferase involved in cell wall biosynthesis